MKKARIFQCAPEVRVTSPYAGKADAYLTPLVVVAVVVGVVRASETDSRRRSIYRNALNAGCRAEETELAHRSPHLNPPRGVENTGGPNDGERLLVHLENPLFEQLVLQVSRNDAQSAVLAMCCVGQGAEEVNDQSNGSQNLQKRFE